MKEEGEEKKYYIAETYYIDSEIEAYQDKWIMEHINDGWELLYIGNKYIAAKKAVSEEEYRKVYDAVAARVERMNNCPYLD